MPNLGFLEILFVFPFLAWLGVWLWTLYDAGSHSDEVWRASGESKLLWFLAIVVLQFFGTVFYLLWVRPKLRLLEEESPAP